ncbi:transcriptional regulator [Pandoraea capi]|uniref:transcriptional regulator n=1 Tax=Pandoraea capi TaxID=2508286 RepID=UPI001242F0EF|nr:YdaS family helix-turn-helix protein [Pandoraea capi]
MDLKTYLDAERGRQRKLARDIGAHPSDVSSWKSGRRNVPSHFAYPIEESTRGAVTRREMLPLDVCIRMWPREFEGSVGESQ